MRFVTSDAEDIIDIAKGGCNNMQELTIRSESIQRIYGFYREKELIVNRRYQRKLVWSIEEKQDFIDSILKEYPVPLILFAEDNTKEEPGFEIIDGMQRLNAIVSFIENEFSVNDCFFDLEAMAESKLLKDTHKIEQKKPILDRKKCVDKIASYVLPISTYRSSSAETIDDVFRRINSNGRHLSRQEIRQAGTVSSFAELVRKLSSEIRGDVTLSDRLYLNDMNQISITSRDLNYGINVDTLFWVQNGIIRRDQVRESKDEEIVADILAAMLLDDIPRSSSKTLDEYYGIGNDNKKYLEVDIKIKTYGYKRLHDDFFKVFDEIKSLVALSKESFNELISSSQSFDKVPRYFQIIFLAFYKAMIKENLKVVSQYNLIKILDGITSNVKLSKGGGNWSATEREKSIDAIFGIIRGCFTANTEDPANVKWSTEFETILRQSEIEQVSFDFKLTFYNLQTKTFNESILDKCIKTLTAMANRGKGCKGYVIIGVADNKLDADKLLKINSKYKAIKYINHYITGLEFDIDNSKLSKDRFFQTIVQKIKQQDIDYKYKSYITNNIRFLKYGNKDVLILEIEGLTEPAMYKDKYYERQGANVEEIQMKNIRALFDRFN